VLFPLPDGGAPGSICEPGFWGGLPPFQSTHFRRDQCYAHHNRVQQIRQQKLRHPDDTPAGVQRSPNLKRQPFVWLLVLATVLHCSLEAQTPAKDNQREQTDFGADWGQGEVFMSRPVRLPLGALRLVRDTLSVGTIECLGQSRITPEQVPASWFAASEIHLAGPEEVDLIVQPDLPKIVGHKFQPDSEEGVVCLLGANVGPFWVIRKNPSGRYGLLLETITHDLTHYHRL